MDIGALPQMLIALFKNQGAEVLQAGKEVAGQFKPGTQYEGKVLEALPNGRNLVQVGQQTLDMALPQQAKPGDVVRLTFLNAAPRPTFILSTAAPTPAQAVNLSQAAQQVNALIRYVPVTAAGPTAPATNTTATNGTAANTAANTTVANPPVAARPIVANPAVLLAPAPASSGPVTAITGPAIPALAMMGEAVEGARASLASNTSLTTQGVVAEKNAAGQLLPVRLQQTVKESGLFYESHLGRWVKGELSLESIQREPQARLAQSPGPLASVPDLDGMPEEAARMASRQLNMLEGGPFVWQGQAWPGQMLEWQVRDQRDSLEPGADDGQPWQSHLRLALPRLGEIAADLDIGAQGLRIRLASPAPETLAEMQAALPELASRMRDAELNLTSLKAELADGPA